MKFAALALVGTLACSTHALLTAPALAIPTVPGAVTNASTTQICVPGYTRTVRPPVSWTNRLKHKLAGTTDVRRYELDHLVPLELGGAPRDLNNLWLQPWPDAHKKDAVENQLHRAVCAGLIRLTDAQAQMKGWGR